MEPSISRSNRSVQRRPSSHIKIQSSPTANREYRIKRDEGSILLAEEFFAVVVGMIDVVVAELPGDACEVVENERVTVVGAGFTRQYKTSCQKSSDLQCRLQ